MLAKLKLKQLNLKRLNLKQLNLKLSLKRLSPNENAAVERLVNGAIKENPLFVLMLGLCPALYVTTSALTGIGMGLTTLCVMVLSNLCLSLIRGSLRDKARLPVYMIIIALSVTLAEVIIKAYLPALDRALGIYLPLIVVNCVIMNRVENYAVKNKPLLAVFDAIGMGSGFTIALMIIGAIRELLGAGELFGIRILPESYQAASIFVLAPGAFFIMAFLAAAMNKFKTVAAALDEKKAEAEKIKMEKAKKEQEEINDMAKEVKGDD